MTECREHDHHWVEELVFEDDEDFEVVGDHVCKHCDVVGIECGACDGMGTTGCDELDADGELELSQDCFLCNGSGITVVPGVTVDEEGAS